MTMFIRELSLYCISLVHHPLRPEWTVHLVTDPPRPEVKVCRRHDR